MSPKNNWFVITGAPSAGKTTVLNELESRGYKIMPEAARSVIDRAIASGISTSELRSDEYRFQQEVALEKKRIEDMLDPREAILFDRGMHDTLAYMKYHGYGTEQWLEDLYSSSRYKKVFLFDPIGWFEKDYARTEGENFVLEIHDLLFEAYKAFGMEPAIVKAMSVEERVEYILNEIKAEVK